MDNFPASKKDRRFHLISLFEEPDDVVLLELVVMLIGIRSKLHFLDRDVLLMLLGFVKFLVQLVKVLAVIHDPADRRLRCRRNFYQVQTPLLRDFDRSRRSQNSELLILIVNDANLASADSPIHPYVFIDGLDLQTETRDKR